MTCNRRKFVATASTALATTLSHTTSRTTRRFGFPVQDATWKRGILQSPSAPDVTTLHDPRIKALALATLDAARTAGAGYADVRLSYTRARYFGFDRPYDQLFLGLSVRALVDGYWGWAATPYVSVEEAPRVGREAVLLAKANATNHPPRRVEWGTVPSVSDGTWNTPLRLDLFEVAIDEILDWINEVINYIEDLGAYRGDKTAGTGPPPYNVEFSCDKQERVFASTEGSYLTQTVSVARPNIGFHYRDINTVLYLPPAQLGWEYVTDLPVQELIRQEMDWIDSELALRLPSRPIEVGRYDVVLSASAMATLVGKTLGTATELDRALGFEANGGGTSYLGPDPLTKLGTSVASPLVSVTADRSTPKALATVHWDEEGIVPEDFALVKNGVLVDYQTTREQAAWLAPWYQKHGIPIHSHGCAASQDARSITMQHTPNLTLQPGSAELGIEEMIASLSHGLVIEELQLDEDFQQLNGFGLVTRVIEVQQGKRVARIRGRAGVLFHTPELWKNITVLGGPKSVQGLHKMWSTKGEPAQGTEYSVAAVPAIIKQLALIDVTKKA